MLPAQPLQKCSLPVQVDYTTRTGTRCAVGYYIYFGVEAAFLLVAAGAYAMWVHRSRVRAHPEPQQAAAGSAAGKAAPAAKPAQAPTGLGTRDSAMEQEGGRPGVGPESDWSIAAVLPSTQDGDSTTVPAAAGMAEANAPRPAAGAAAGQLGVGESSGAESKGAAEWSVGTILTIQLVMVFGGTLATMLGLGGGEGSACALLLPSVTLLCWLQCWVGPGAAPNVPSPQPLPALLWRAYVQAGVATFLLS